MTFMKSINLQHVGLMLLLVGAMGGLSACGTSQPIKTGISTSDYLVGDLLTTCQEGDNASRDGELAAQELCSHYLGGFADAFQVAGVKGYCIPSGPGRLDTMRRDFIKYAANNTNSHSWPAVDGLLATFECE